MKRPAAAPHVVLALSLCAALSPAFPALADAPAAAGREVATPVLFLPGTAVEVYAAGWDDTSGWDICGRPEDRPMTYSAVTDGALVRQGAGAVRLDFDAAVGPVGMKYFYVGDVSGSDGYAFWVHGDGSGAALQVRLSQGDWSAWDSPILRLDFTGWRRVVVLRDECRFHHWGGRGQNWDDIKVFAVRLAEQSCRVEVDDLRFYAGTAGVKVTPIPPAEPVTLRVDLSATLPPIPPMLKGVDFAMVNWGASRENLRFDEVVQPLLRQSGAKLVRFWTYCPPLEVSPAEGRYDWTRFDAQMAGIRAAGARTIMTCCFTPTWLSVDGTKEGMPRDLDAYERLIHDTVRHCVEQGFDVAYWECWNEPNLGGGFLKGDIEEYLSLYTRFARAVRAADPSAKVGGPALVGLDLGWVRAKLAYAAEHGIPVDFISWHEYELPPDGHAALVRKARGVVDSFEAFRGIELIVSEWNADGGPQNAWDTEFAAAFQAAALHRMLEAGLSAQAFFAFNESEEREFGDGVGGRNWGMLTHSGVPKASFHSFRIFAELTGPRYAVTGGDGEVGAIACAGDDGGVDIMIHRFQPDADAPERPVTLELAGWPPGQAMSVSLELVDDSHANAAYDRSQRELKQVAHWSPVAPDGLGRIVLPLRPLSVARVRVRPVEPAENALESLVTTEAPRVWTHMELAMEGLPQGGTQDIRWDLPDGWEAAWRSGRWRIRPAGSERIDRVAYLGATLSGSTVSVPVRVLAPRVLAEARLLGEGPFRPGTTRTVRVTVTDSMPAVAEYTVSLDTGGLAAAEPAETPLQRNFEVEARSDAGVAFARPAAALDFQVSLPAEFEGESVFIRPVVRVRRLVRPDASAEGQDGAAPGPGGLRPLSVALPDPLAEPTPDEHTRFFSTLGSAGAIATPARGAGGELQDARFAPGRFGDGVLLSESELRFPAEGSFPADVGTLELWLTPLWDGKDAPGWGTPFLRVGESGWARSMWDLLIRPRNGVPHLEWDLCEESGRTHTLSTDISGWKAGEARHVMISWNGYSGRMALYVDGRLADERRAPGGLVLHPAASAMFFNKIGGRNPSRCVYGPVRISNVERVVGAEAPAPYVPIRTIGLEAAAGQAP